MNMQLAANTHTHYADTDRPTQAKESYFLALQRIVFENANIDMIGLIFYLVIITSTPDDTLCKERFYREATKDSSVLSTYLKLEINDSTGNKKEVLIPNYSLYRFLKVHYGMNYEDYRKYINSVYKILSVSLPAVLDLTAVLSGCGY